MKYFTLTLPALLLLVLVVPPAQAGIQDGVQWVPSLTEAMKQAKERGSMIYIAMTMDNEQSNDAQKAEFQNAAFIKATRNFVCVYANPTASQTTEVEVDGKMVRRLVGAETITPKDSHKSYNEVQKNYSRNRASDESVKMPYNFCIDANGEFIGEATVGTVEGGFDFVPADILVQWLNAIVTQKGKGLTTKEYMHLKKVLADAKEAKKKKELKKALKLLNEVYSANKRSSLADEAKKLIDQISEGAKASLEEAMAKVEGDPIEGMIALEQVAEDYPGTVVAKTAKAKVAELKKRKDVKKRLKEVAAQKQAMKEIEKAEKLVSDEEYVRAIAALKKIAKKYKDIPAGKTAADRVAELSNNEEIAKKIHTQKAKAFGKRTLSMGRNYVKNGMKDKAVKEFQKIIDKYPDSPWAEEAKKELEKLK